MRSSVSTVTASTIFDKDSHGSGPRPRRQGVGIKRISLLRDTKHTQVCYEGCCRRCENADILESIPRHGITTPQKGILSVDRGRFGQGLEMRQVVDIHS